jgi:hypothetical protein
MSDKFEQWAIVEVMGHTKYAGLVSEQAIGGGNFLRVDVPKLEADGRTAEQQPFTKYLGSGSIFSITPVSEEIARHVAATLRAAPVHVYDLPQLAQRRLPRIDRADDDCGDEGEF